MNLEPAELGNSQTPAEHDVGVRDTMALSWL